MVFTIKLALVAYLFLVLWLDHVWSFWSEFEIRSLEGMNGTTGQPFVFNLRPKRIKKGIYGISGTIEVNDNINDYEISANFYHSSSGNDFKPTPLMIPRGTGCEKANSEYRKFLMNDLHKNSDLPYTKDPADDICELIVIGKKYTITDYQFDSNITPRFLQSGMYKLQIAARKNDVVLSGVDIMFDLS